MEGRVAPFVVALTLLVALAGCGFGAGQYQEDKGPPPKITDEERAKMEGLTVEQWRKQQAFKSGGGPAQGKAGK